MLFRSWAENLAKKEALCVKAEALASSTAWEESAAAVKQLQAANPQLYDAKAVDLQVLKIMGWDNPESLFAPPQLPAEAPPDPRMAKVQVEAAAKMDELKTRAAIAQAEMVEKTKDRDLKKQLAMIDLARTLAVHPEAEALAERTVSNPVMTTPQ